ncbi:NAD-dependent epimerase/dehydratase family protein [Blautia schinkii]|nr:NAD-dependent epimerase/dehydratase family protein [Blautia schinkii]
MTNPILLQDMEDIYARNVDWRELDRKTVLLTGAYGMLASYIVYYLMYLRHQKSIDVRLITVVRNKEKFIDRFSNVQGIEKIRVIQDDLSHSLNIDSRIDYIIHAASLASPQYYSVCPVEVLSPNTLGTYYLLQLAREKACKGFLLFSTCDVYGTPVSNGTLIDENSYGSMDTLDIHNCYSESKRMSETMCKAFQVQYHVPVKIARIAHTYAPTMDIQNDPRVFASFVKNIVDGQNIVMKSDGTGKRSFCYITDAVAGYFTILLKGKDGEAYNVCNTDQFVSIRELAECLTALYPERNLRVIRKVRDKSEHYTENSLLVGCERVPSHRKLKELGWNAEVGIKEGFGRVVEYIENAR